MNVFLYLSKYKTDKALKEAQREADLQSALAFLAIQNSAVAFDSVGPVLTLSVGFISNPWALLTALCI
jgi:hypothetical protein